MTTETFTQAPASIPDSTETIESEEFRQQANAAHQAICRSLETLKIGWVSLGRACKKFHDSSYHLGIVDPKTGKPFANFATWARSVFGKSQSTIFKEIRILKVLEGKVKDNVLAKMRKENAHHLADHAAAGKEITPEMVNKAVELPEREFRETLKQSDASGSRENIHPRKFSTDVSPETYARLEEMLCAARLRTGGRRSPFGINDLALRDVADEYLKWDRGAPKKDPDSEPVKSMAVAV